MPGWARVRVCCLRSTPRLLHPPHRHQISRRLTFPARAPTRLGERQRAVEMEGQNGARFFFQIGGSAASCLANESMFSPINQKNSPPPSHESERRRAKRENLVHVSALPAQPIRSGNFRPVRQNKVAANAVSRTRSHLPPVFFSLFFFFFLPLFFINQSFPLEPGSCEAW